MRYMLTTDTHFGHEKLIEYGRPLDFEKRILQNLRLHITSDDVLIHLGDVSIRDDKENHSRILSVPSKLKWLIKGNHDKRSDTWYLDMGWDFVGSEIRMKRYGHHIVLSHVPIAADGWYDLNIHGHFHDSDHRRHEPELLAIANPHHYLLMLEHHYKPVSIESIVKELEHA